MPLDGVRRHEVRTEVERELDQRREKNEALATPRRATGDEERDGDGDPRRPVDEIAPEKTEDRTDVTNAIDDAVEAGAITSGEAATLRVADAATDRVIRVDDFSSEDLMRIESQREPRRAAQ